MTKMDNDKVDDSCNEIGAPNIDNFKEMVMKFLKCQLTLPMKESVLLSGENAPFSKKLINANKIIQL